MTATDTRHDVLGDGIQPCAVQQRQKLSLQDGLEERVSARERTAREIDAGASGQPHDARLEGLDGYTSSSKRVGNDPRSCLDRQASREVNESPRE